MQGQQANPQSELEAAVKDNNHTQEEIVNRRVVANQDDLFLSKEEQLKRWMKSEGFFSTHDVMIWGVNHYYNRANRTKQDFCNKGIIRVLNSSEKILRGFLSKDAWYEWVGQQEFAGVK